jgi:hypothetical protein
MATDFTGAELPESDFANLEPPLLSDFELVLSGMEGAEGWLLFASQEAEIDLGDVPNDKAEIGTKTHSERLRSVIYVWYKQSIADQSFIGEFDMFYKTKLEKIIEGVKSKLND